MYANHILRMLQRGEAHRRKGVAVTAGACQLLPDIGVEIPPIRREPLWHMPTEIYIACTMHMTPNVTYGGLLLRNEEKANTALAGWSVHT